MPHRLSISGKATSAEWRKCTFGLHARLPAAARALARTLSTWTKVGNHLRGRRASSHAGMELSTSSMRDALHSSCLSPPSSDTYACTHAMHACMGPPPQPCVHACDLAHTALGVA